MVLCVTVPHLVDGFFLRYTEHVTPTINPDILEVPAVNKCKCDAIIANNFKLIQPNTVTTTMSSQKFPLAVPMFSSYGWGPQG